jgi:hypothetical protein
LTCRHIYVPNRELDMEVGVCWILFFMQQSPMFCVLEERMHLLEQNGTSGPEFD